MAYNQKLVDSFGELYETQANKDFGATDAFNQGKELVTDQIDSNKKASQDKEDRKSLVDKRDREEQLSVMDLEKKTVAYQAEKEEYFRLMDEGIESGLINPADYSGYQNNRESFWKDIGKQAKIKGLITDKAAFRTRVGNAVKAEQAWGGITELSKNINISDNSAEAQRMDLALDRWGAKSDSPPPIITKGGIDYFSIPATDGGEDILISVEKAAGGNPNDVFPEYDELQTIEGVQLSIGESALKDSLSKGYATEVEVKDYIKKEVLKKDGSLDKVKLAEIVGSLKLSDVQLESHGVTETDGVPGITEDDVTLSDIQDIFYGIVEEDYGKQGKPKPLSIGEQKDLSIISKNNAAAAQTRLENKDINEAAALDELNRVEAANGYDAWQQDPSVANLGKLKNKGNVEDIYYKEPTEAITLNGKTTPAIPGGWFITQKEGGIVSAGSDKEAGPDDAAIRSVLGLGDDYTPGEFDDYL